MSSCLRFFRVSVCVAITDPSFFSITVCIELIVCSEWWCDFRCWYEVLKFMVSFFVSLKFGVFCTLDHFSVCSVLFTEGRKWI